MSASAVEILRRQLREKFPQAMAFRPHDDDAQAARERAPQVGKALTLLDEFPSGAISEVVAAGPGAGLALVIAGLLGESEAVGGPPAMVLVDGADGFDPASFPGPACARLLWVRCHSGLEMIKAADWLIHDGNVPLVVLDATGLAQCELQTLPATAWWRLKLGAEQSGSRLVVLAPQRLVTAARVRLQWSAELQIDDFDARREDLWSRMRQQPARRQQL